MQTTASPEVPRFWSEWAEAIHRLGLGDFAAWFLDVSGPLSVLGAQLLYLGEPLLRPRFSHQQFDSLAELLEDDETMKAFSAYLRERGCV